ncbi:maestro heat-like repeat family member 5 [Liasis olivaceus]
MLSVMDGFYRPLFAGRGDISEEAVERYFSGLPPPGDGGGGSGGGGGGGVAAAAESAARLAALGGPISAAEVREVLRGGRRRSAPGPDGLGWAFYRAFADRLAGPLAALFERCAEDARAGEDGAHLPASQYQGLLLFFTKPGALDRTLPSSWRPIVLTNVDYRALARLLADRLAGAVGRAVVPTQTSALPGRGLVDSLCLLREVFWRAGRGEWAGFLLQLDQSRAFDRVHHAFLWRALAWHGVPRDFVRLVQLLYVRATVVPQVNNARGAAIPVRSGVRQGCPMSPLLYVLALDVALWALERDGGLRGFDCPLSLRRGGPRPAVRAVKFVAHADNVSLLVRSRGEARRARAALRAFEAVSGAQVNDQKSWVVALGAAAGGDGGGGLCRWPVSDWWAGQDGEREREAAPRAQSGGGAGAGGGVDLLEELRPPRTVRVLGVRFGLHPDAWTDNWDRCAARWEARWARWRRRGLSLYQRAIYLRAYLLSQAALLAAVYPPPEAFLRRVARGWFGFLWGTAFFPLARAVAHLPVREGGLGLPALELSLWARFLAQNVGGASVLLPPPGSTGASRGGVSGPGASPAGSPGTPAESLPPPPPPPLWAALFLEHWWGSDWGETRWWRGGASVFRVSGPDRGCLPTFLAGLPVGAGGTAVGAGRGAPLSTGGVCAGGGTRRRRPPAGGHRPPPRRRLPGGEICSVFKRVSHKKNRVRAHPLREETCNSSRDFTWQKEKAEAPEEELNENESQLCFCNLRNLREGNGPSLVQESTNNLCILAETKLAGVLRAICKYRNSIHKISPKHRLRINQILQAVIRSASYIDHKLAKVIIKLAAEDMLRTTDLQDLYQDAAGDILVALWSHFPAEVLTKLLEGFQGRLIPYRSILCVLGKLANKAFTESDSLKTDVWERKLVEFAERLLIDVTDKACFEELNQELRKVDQKCSYQGPERIFLYQYCGAILRASDDSQLIQDQLSTILAMSQRGALEAKGIAAACGLAASRHLDEVFKVLEDFSKTLSATEILVSRASQFCQRNTLLLCYGRVALGIKEEVLPRVELIVARLIEYFIINPSDLNLKKSFLIAVLMLLEAIAATGKAKVVRLHLKSHLVECLIVLIEREPLHILGSTVRQDAMYIVKELSNLKPLLDPEKKSSLLCASFKSVFCLAPMEILEGQSCIDEKTADIKGFYQQTIGCFEEMLQALLLENPHPNELKHMMELIEPWMISKLNHVRERAVETVMKLLKFVAERFHLDLSREFSKLAHLTAVLIGLCNDPVPCISSFAVQGVSCLYELLLRRKGMKTSKQKKLKWSMKRSVKLQEQDCPAFLALGSSWQIAMVLWLAPRGVGYSLWAKFPLGRLTPSGDHCGDQLFSAQLTNLLLSVLDYLRGSSPEVLKAAEEVLSAVLQNHAMKVERVRDVVGGIYVCLQLRHASYWTRKVVLRALALMIPYHLEEVMQCCLSFSIPLNRQASELWTAMASSPKMAVQILHLLLKNLQVKDRSGDGEDSTATSLAAMNVIYETFRIPGYRAALAEMHLQLFIPLLKQVLYVMQLNLPEALKTRQEIILRENPTALSFQSTSVEIVKNLFSVTGDWAVYACIEFQQGWGVLSTPQHFLQGTRLLARAMTECNSAQIPGVFGEAALILSSEEDELKKMTALALVIEFLKSPSAIKMMNRFSLKDHLEEGLAAHNPVVQDLCVKGLNSFVFQQGKVKSLRDQLPTMINSIFSGHEEDVLEGLNDIMTTLYEMDGQGIGLLCVDLALNVRSFFEDERVDVRATAISLFGQLVMRAKETDKALLKKEVVYSLLPLLLHLKDRESTVAMSCKLTLLHCGVFLGWAHLKLMFRSLAWDDLRSCLMNVWKYLMRNNHDNIHIFVSQALGFLHHPQTEIRNAAARFMGYTLNYYSSELSKNLEQEDLFYLNKVFQKMESSSDTSTVHFAKTYRVVLQKLSVKRRLAGAGERDAQASDSNAPGEAQLGPHPLHIPASKQQIHWPSLASLARTSTTPPTHAAFPGGSLPCSGSTLTSLQKSLS